MLVALAVTSLTSCTNDNASLIIGKWNVTKAKSEAVIGSINVPKDLTTAYRAFEFQEDGTCLMTTRAINPMTNEILSDKDSVRHYKWELTDNDTKVHISTPSNYNINYDIQYLDESKLTLYGETYDTVPGFPELGKATMKMTINLTK